MKLILQLVVVPNAQTNFRDNLLKFSLNVVHKLEEFPLCSVEVLPLPIIALALFFSLPSPSEISRCLCREERCIQRYSYFEKGCRKKMCPRKSRKVTWVMINTLFLTTVAVECTLALANTFPWPFVSILSNFFEKQRTQNHPQCLSGLSHALFPTTFLEIAGNTKCAEVAGPDQRAAKQMRPGTVQINHSLPKVNLSFSR